MASPPCALPALPKLHFSCSHTPWVSAIAVASFHPVGIDIERVEPACVPSLIDDYLTANERLAVSLLPIGAPPGAYAALGPQRSHHQNAWHGLCL